MWRQIRHGTTTLFAALNVATGTVIGRCRRRHHHQEFLAFLRHIDASVPSDLAIHLIVDNYATHKHPKVRTWLGLRPRYHVHYTPTYASWLNTATGSVGEQACGSFRSVKELIAKIDHFVLITQGSALQIGPRPIPGSRSWAFGERISGTQHYGACPSNRPTSNGSRLLRR